MTINVLVVTNNKLKRLLDEEYTLSNHSEYHALPRRNGREKTPSSTHIHIHASPQRDDSISLRLVHMHTKTGTLKLSGRGMVHQNDELHKHNRVSAYQEIQPLLH
jgi:hypothetical protein